jgi:predicted acetyltransferase
MIEIRPIESRQDQESYRALARYCFVDTTGWVDQIIPLPEDLAGEYGAFEDGRLTTALISNSYVCSLFGKEHKMSGIGAVASWPQDRGKGHVRSLMHHAMRKDHGEGKTVSTLYPFKYSFYNKFGYGSIGGFALYKLAPLDIRQLPPLKGEWIVFDCSEEMLGDYKAVVSAWASHFDFACLPASYTPERIRGILNLSKEHCYLYRSGGETKAMIRYALTVIGPYAKRLEVRKSAWTDVEGFGAIFSFLGTHRDQIPEIEWRAKRDLPVHLMTKEPRIQCSLSWDWMARPLDLPRLLADKAEAEGFDGRTEFSVVDDVIESNTGAYRVENGKVTRTARPADNPIDMPVLSSLLFGGMTYTEAVSAGHALSPQHRELFSRRRPIWLSEMF